MPSNDINLTVSGSGARRRRSLRSGILVVSALIGGGIGGTGGFALAAGPWQDWHPGHRLEHMQAMVHRALEGVGATTAQEAKIHDIIASTMTGMEQTRSDREARRKQMIDLLRAPTIDRNAVEKQRADEVAAFDAHSKTFTSAILDAADQLSPAQRSALADRIEQRMDRHEGPGGEGWHGHHRGDKGDDGRHGPATEPGDGSDKG